MRLLLAMMKHETNTFSPVIDADLPRFASRAATARMAVRRPSPPIAAPARSPAPTSIWPSARAPSSTWPIAAGAPPSGPVDDDAFEHIADAICAAVRRGGYDGILLDLHGAMVTRSLRRRRRRAAAPHPRRSTPNDADRGVARHARQPVSGDRRQRRRGRRLPDLSAYRHATTPPACRQSLLKAMSRRDQADDGLGQRADAAARDAPGHGRRAQRALQARCAGDEAEGALARQPVHRLSARRHHQCRPERGRGHRRRQGARPSACATSCSTRPGRTARPSSTSWSRSRNRGARQGA